MNAPRPILAAALFAALGDPALPPRFWDKVEVSPNGCWEWRAYIDERGYGMYSHERRTRKVHRLSYLTLVGPVPEGLVLDHLCRNRACVNPAHLEPVTPLENARRGIGGQMLRNGDVCRNGLHPWPEFAVPNAGRVVCGPCREMGHQRRLARRRAVAS